MPTRPWARWKRSRRSTPAGSCPLTVFPGREVRGRPSSWPGRPRPGQVERPARARYARNFVISGLRIGGKIPLRAGCLQDGAGEHVTLIRHAEPHDPAGVPGPQVVGDLAGTHGEENLFAVSGLDERGRENSPLRGRQEREYEFRSLVEAALTRARWEGRQGVAHRDDAAGGRR